MGELRFQAPIGLGDFIHFARHANFTPDHDHDTVVQTVGIVQQVCRKQHCPFLTEGVPHHCLQDVAPLDRIKPR